MVSVRGLSVVLAGTFLGGSLYIVTRSASAAMRRYLTETKKLIRQCSFYNLNCSVSLTLG
jgi:hypothetical protein